MLEISPLTRDLYPAAGPSGQKGLFLLGSLGFGGDRWLYCSAYEPLYIILVVFSLDRTA